MGRNLHSLALDPAGDVSSGTSYTWTSDTTAPPPPTFSGTHPGKLVTIVLENESHPAIVGNPNAPYLNQLIANGEEFTNYFAVDTTGSFPNYLAMTSGNSSATALSPNIFQAIDATGGALTWKEFMESMQGNCAQGTSGTSPARPTRSTRRITIRACSTAPTSPAQPTTFP